MSLYVDGLDKLANAVLEKAKEDYIAAKVSLKKAEYNLKELEGFFNDEDGAYKLYIPDTVQITGTEVMNELDDIVKKKFKTWKRKQMKEA